MAALTFSFDTLKTGGHFLCKYYQGSEEKAFETKLKRLFAKVHREKPDSSRNVCLLATDKDSMLTVQGI
jgi:21S rRNA (uridine2791-2'-O)-methyltransferase